MTKKVIYYSRPQTLANLIQLYPIALNVPQKKKNETIDLNKNPNQYYYRHHENHNIHQVKNSL